MLPVPLQRSSCPGVQRPNPVHELPQFQAHRSFLPCKALHRPDFDASACCSTTSPPFPPGDEAIPTDVPLQPVLTEKASLLHAELHDCLARVGSLLARAEAALGKPSVVPVVSLLPKLQVRSTDEGDACLYGCFSPRARPCLRVVPTASGSEVIAEVVASVLQILPELQKLGEEPTTPLSMVLPMGSLRASTVATTPPQPLLEPNLPLAFVEHGGLDTTVLHSSSLPVVPTASGSDAEVVAPVMQIMPEMQELCGEPTSPISMVVPVGDEVGQASDADALFVKELCDVLVSLEAASPGYGKTIACLLTGKTSRGKIKKVDACPHAGIPKEKSVRSRGKKSGAIRKASATA